MAYDAHGDYQPPQRSYYGQTQQAPVQQAYEQPQDRYRQDPYEQGYGQSYGTGQQDSQSNGYGQSNGLGEQDARSNGYGQERAPAQQQEGYSDGYYGGYQKPKRISGGALGQGRQSPAPQQVPAPQQTQQYERNYDPRYQQRPGRSTPQGNGQHSGQRAMQQVQAQAPVQDVQQGQQYQQPQQPTQQAPQSRAAVDPRNGYPQPGPQARQSPAHREPYQPPPQAQEHQPQQAPRERQGYQVQPAPQSRGPVDPRNGYPQPSPQQRQSPAPREQYRAPQQPQQPQQQQQQQQPHRQPEPRSAPALATQKVSAKPEPPKKQTMEEWKAAEKARLRQADVSPGPMPSDSAFPTFPNTKPPKKEGDRSGTAMSKRSRQSEEQGRDSVSSGPLPRTSGQHQRPGMPREGSGYRGEDRPDMPKEHGGYRNGAQQCGERPDMPRANSSHRHEKQQLDERPPIPREESGYRDEAQQQHGRQSASREQRPSVTRDDAYRDEVAQQRPVYDRVPSAGQRVPQEQQTYPPPHDPSRPLYDRQASSGQRVPQMQHAAPLREEKALPPPGQAHQEPPHPDTQDWHARVYGQPMQTDGTSRDAQRSPPPARGYGQSPPPIVQDRYAPGYGQQTPAQMIPQQSRAEHVGGARRPVAPIDTSQANRPAYMDHQPLSPAHVPPRPSTAQAGRSPTSNLQVGGVRSPGGASALSYEMTPTGYKGGDELPRMRSNNDTLGDVYDRYHEPEPQSAGGPRSNREIDNEMPDFDSAAPGGTSLLHKRVQEQAPTQVVAQQQRVVAAPAPVVNGGFEFGVPAQQVVAQPERGYYDQDYAPSRDAGYGDIHAPPQPAFATEPVVRRSMDDARQMPYRQAPPAAQHPQDARYGQNGGQPPSMQYPPQQRPGMDARNVSAQTMQSVGQAPRSAAYPPQQRPGMDGRNVSGQSVQSGRPEFVQPSGGAAYPRPSTANRNNPGQAMQAQWADPNQRVPSAPPLRQGLQEPPGRPGNGAPLSQQRSAPEHDQRRGSNPDALPRHPVPVRPGLMEGGINQQQPSKAPPVRQYDAAAAPTHARQASVERPAQPVTLQELDQLRAAVAANPANNKQALVLAKRLVEASTVLASEGGRADPRTTAKNREKYVLEAHKRIKKLATAGYPDAQFYLADSYGQGSLGLEMDTKEAFNMYQAAAKQGHPQAAYRTAVCCEMGPEEGGGTRRDYAKAVQWYRRAAALGDVPAMYKLGIILLKGLLGQQRNLNESVVWLKRAAENADKSNPHALHELGTLYESTNTIPDVRSKLGDPDDAYARELFKRAAGLGYKFSQFRLGQAYEYGTLGLGIDHRASISWYSKAAAQGEHQAELALSGWYLTGAEGILGQSDTEAYLWARKAAQAEPPLGKAMFAMGYFSEMGIGCPASVEEARRWYGRAAAYKFPKALERLEELKKSGKNRPAPVNGKLARKDQKRDETECSVM
ncbi:hypothetical protein LTS10_006387 [Elasticomyces elasticus]|nr:hypothetical protein LTS10_006387 [Elasticomyces elasticus]